MTTTVAPAAPHTEAVPTEERKQKPKKQPRYNVVLLDDNDHTYEYVIRMLCQLFHMDKVKALNLAIEVDTAGRVIVLTTTREHAELKQQQIHNYGADPLIAHCKGSMSAIVEPV